MVPLEMLVHEAMLVLRNFDLSKAIEVKLANEGRQVSMLEVLRQHLFTEPGLVLDEEVGTVVAPADNF